MPQKDTRRAIALVYGTSGLPFGILNEALPLLLHHLQLAAGGIGLASLLQLPWTLKVLWAPLVDRAATASTWFRGTAWCLSASFFVMGVACWLNHVPLLLVAAACCAAAAATFDLTADGVFVRLLATGRLRAGPDSGLRTLAYKAGVMLGSGASIALAAACGWSAPFFALSLWTLFLRHRFARVGEGLPPQPRVGVAVWRGALRAWLNQPGTPSLLLFIFGYKLALASAAPMAKLGLISSGLSLVSVGASLALLGFVGTTLGAGTAVLLMRQLGLARTLLVGSASEALACCCYALVCTYGPVGPAGWPACNLVEAWAQGLTTTALGALLAEQTDQRFAATHFGLMTSLFGLTRACGGPLGGLLVTKLGLTGFFCTAPVLALLSLWPLRHFWLRLPQRQQPANAV